MRCTPEHAFATYTGRISEWWDPRYTANAETLQSVTVEPHVGGRVYATHRDMGKHDWGEVSVWEPGRRLVHTFTLAQDPQHPSEVAVEFVPGDTSTFLHGPVRARRLDRHKRGRAKEVRRLAHHARPVHGACRLRPLSALTSRRGI